MSKEVLYQFALNQNEELINIDSVKPGGKYICPGCKTEMIARCGQKNQHHFAHKPISELNNIERHSVSDCISSNETYLHNAFKIGLYQILKTKIENKEDFIINWNPSNIGIQQCNLLKTANKIELEKYVDELKPDLVLYNKNGRAYVAIEIVVNHKPNREKLSYYSENNIILYEIDLNKNDFHVLNNIEEVASFPTVFSYIPDLQDPNIQETRKCKNCGEQTLFSYINITKVKCPDCNTINRCAFRTTSKNKMYHFNKYTTITEKNIFDIHGLSYNKETCCFICENCKRGQDVVISNIKEKKTYPLGYFCCKCQKYGIIYKNQKFQNHAEEKWAKFFDENNIEYEYNLKDYRFSEINPFPIFYLKNSKQLFRANRYNNYEEKYEKDLDKAQVIFDKTGIDVIIGSEDGCFCVFDENDFSSEDDSLLVQCQECKTYYFTTNNSDWTCKKCKYYAGDNTFQLYKRGDDEGFDSEYY